MSGSSSQLSQSAVNPVTVPAGRIIVAHSWQGTQLTAHLSQLTDVLYSDGTGVVDFYPSDDAAVMFVSEADIMSGGSFKRRLVKFRHHNTSQRGVVIAENTRLTNQEISKIQKFVSIELGLAIIPVQSVEEAAQLLAQMVTCEAKFNANPFRIKPKTVNNTDAAILATVKTIPGLGETRGRLLLQQFGSMRAVAAASQDSIAKVIGQAAAQSVYQFLHNPQ